VIVEQVIADLKAGPLAHLPSGSLAANSPWLVLTATAFNLTRAADTLASTFHAKATTVTLDVSPPAPPAVRSLTRPRRSVDGVSARPRHDVSLRSSGSM
jgi:hypothetical protein